MMGMEMLEVMRRRRSIRKFTSEKVSDADVEALVNEAVENTEVVILSPEE